MGAPAAPPSPFRAVAGGLRIAVKLTPRASRDAIGGATREAGGGAALKVAVTAAPEGGKANAALIALLAKSWRLPKSAFAVVAGAADRRKTLHLSGEPAILGARLAAWLEEHHD